MSFIELTDRRFAHRRTFGALRDRVRAGSEYLSQRLYHCENDVWYFLKLNGSQRPLARPKGFKCVRAAGTEQRMGPSRGALRAIEARRRLSNGADLWKVNRADHTVGAFWAFHRHMPLRAVRGGWLTLPTDAVCVETATASIAGSDRRALAAAWLWLAEREALAGARVVLAKVAEDDEASRRSAELAGFQLLACLSFFCICLYWRARVYLISGDPIVDFLIEQLAG